MENLASVGRRVYLQAHYVVLIMKVVILVEKETILCLGNVNKWQKAPVDE